MKAGEALPPLEKRVTARMIIMGASSSRDWQPQHHDHHWAVERAGTRDIFLNTPNQAGWIERFVTDWGGPRARLGRLWFRMRRPICDGDTVAFEGTVRSVETDEAGCTWALLDIGLRVGAERATECRAIVAVPASDDDNPWARRGDTWRPPPFPKE